MTNPRRAWVAALVLAAALAARAGADPVEVSGPALDYVINCQGCHRADGGGTPDSIPALASSVARFLRVPGGREYLARVPGMAQAPLDDAAAAAVLNWMLERFDARHVPPGFIPYTGAEMGTLRRAPLIDVDGTRRRLLTALESGD